VGIGIVLVLLLGIFSYITIGTGLFPETNLPVVTVSVSYPGASAEEIAEEITGPIEDVIAGLAGLETTRSFAAGNYGVVAATFRMSTDPDTVLPAVQQALADIADRLPADASRPTIVKQDVNNLPVMIVSVSGTTDRDALHDAAESVRSELRKLKGVGDIRIEGDPKPGVAVRLDRDALVRHGVSVNALLFRLRSENVFLPAGRLESADTGESGQARLVAFKAGFTGEADIEGLMVPASAGPPVRLDRIARVRTERPLPETLVRSDGSAAVGLFIRKQKDANIIGTAKRIRGRLKVLEHRLPSGVALSVAADSSEFIRSTLNETKRNLLEGVLMTALVLVLFLRRWRSSLIVLIAIPCSVFAAILMMRLTGCTFNIISLTALAMCVGILVDDSIVVLENIHRHLHAGEEPDIAAVEGRMEIGRAAVAITLCDVVVFAPFAFLHDLVGQFFRQFGLTVVFAALFSLLVSFTITPLLAARLYRSRDVRKIDHDEDERPDWWERMFELLVRRPYAAALDWALGHRKTVLSIVAILLAAAISLIPLKVISTEFMPAYDQSRIEIDLSMDRDADLRATEVRAAILEKRLAGLPEVRDTFTQVGIDNDFGRARIMVNLVPKRKRSKSQADVIRKIRTWGPDLAPDTFSVVDLGLVQEQKGGKPVEITLTSANAGDLKSAADEAGRRLAGIEGLVDLGNSLANGQEEIEAVVRRNRAAQAGLSAWEIAEVLRTAVSGIRVGLLRKDGEESVITVGFQPGQTDTIGELESLVLLGRTGPVKLGDVVAFGRTSVPPGVRQLDGRRAAVLSANIEGRPLGRINRDIRRELDGLAGSYRVEIHYGGDQDLMADSFSSMIVALIASIILVYVILVVLYGSFLTPVIRMLSIPCGVIGSLAALAVTGKPLSLVCLIGFIMLDGLVSKNGTLLIDYTNTLMKRGRSLREAIREAGATRIRPILMTSVTMIAGMLPLALSLGDGSEIKSGMAVVLIGGLVASTLISPLILPVVYTLIDDLRRSFSKGREGYAETAKNF
jgi:HAE1 family hydrophobic/amphiphilic exporter-1